MRIAVAGGTGMVGKHVVAEVRARGHEAVVLTRSTGVDLTTGTGLDRALDGVAVVIDVSNLMTVSRRRSVSFFETATRNLLHAEARTGVTHHVALSIVGSDRVELGYYAGKRRQEELVRGGSVPGTILRATQFHELVPLLVDRQRGPLVVIPRMRTQPIAAREVAEAVVARAVAEPAGMASELAGPERHEMADLARLVLRARGSRKTVVSPRLPGRVGRAMAAGGQLPTGPGPRGTITFAQWLAAAPPR